MNPNELPPPKTRAIRWLVWSGVICLLLAGCGYRARDYDPTLTAHAQSAVPILRAIENYRKKEGKLPRNYADFRSYLPDGANSPPDEGASREFHGWTYDSNGAEYWLAFSLGWDPVLYYHSSDDSWEYDPGNGTPKTKVKLRLEWQHEAPKRK